MEQIKVYWLESDAILDSRAVSSLISEDLGKRISHLLEQKPVKRTVANGQRAVQTETIFDSLVFFDALHISVNNYVTENLLRKVLIEDLALETIRGCLDFGLQQVALFAGDGKAILPLEYAYVDAPVSSDSDSESEDFTSISEVGLGAKDELVVTTA